MWFSSKRQLQRECHKALTSEAQASPRVDVGDIPVFGTEIEHEGKSVKEPSVPEVSPVFVWSLMGPHLVFHVSGCTPFSSLVSEVTAQAMSGSAPSSWPLPPGAVQNRRQPWNVAPRETHYPARPPTGPNFSTAPTCRPTRNKGNKQPNPGASFQIQQLEEMLAQIGCSTEVMLRFATVFLPLLLQEIRLRISTGREVTFWIDSVGPNRTLPIFKVCVTSGGNN